MKNLSILAVTSLMLTACNVQEIKVDSPPTPEQKAAIERENQITAARRSNPEVNWVLVGISTGKYDEHISSEVYKTFEECQKGAVEESSTCVPVPALPQSYWDVEK